MLLDDYRSHALAALRIISALLFIEHGTQKLLGFPSQMGTGTVSGLASILVIAGLLEIIGGLLLLVGFKTRLVALILSGEMAIAYWSMHAPHSFFPILNGGDAAILFCFVFLYLVFAGPGKWSVDGRTDT